MDFAFTEEQEMLKNAAREFVRRHCPTSFVREMERDERGYSQEMWQEMAELGWLGCCFPEEYGGIGGNYFDLIVLVEEFGRALIPAPFLPTVVYCGLPILSAGTEKQKEEFLPRIAQGEIRMSLALTEQNVSCRASGIHVQAKLDKDEYILHGNKLFVADAHAADWFLCVTRTREAEMEEEKGITLFLVDAKSPGIKCNLLRTMGSDKQCEVVFDHVRVPEGNRIGETDHGWKIVKKIILEGAIANCALMLGGSEQVIEMVVNYAKERVQFGRPIGSFQAIQHQCADMAMDLLVSKNLSHQAAWMISEGIPCTKEVAMAKGWVSEAYERILFFAAKIHGAIGLTEEYDLSLYFKRAKKAQYAFGDSDFHKELVAEAMGL